VNESPVGSQSRDLARTAVRVESWLSKAELSRMISGLCDRTFLTAFRKDIILTRTEKPVRFESWLSKAELSSPTPHWVGFAQKR